MPDPLDERLEDDVSEAPERAGLDPLTKRLVIVSAVLVVAIIATTGAIVYFASVGSKTPRTAVERDAMVALGQVQKTPKDPNAWMTLASADIEAGKYDDAAAAIKGLSALTNRSVVLILKGDLATAQGDISGARGFYTQAVAQAKKDHEADIGKAAQSGVNPSSVGQSRPEEEAYIALGRLDLRVKDYEAAIKHLQGALAIDPNAADALTMLGDAQTGAGQKDAARKSYTSALKFVPDYQPALDGLKQLQGGK